MRPKKSLGQNFLTSKSIAGDIIKTANLSKEDTVLEIGPGKGFLTEELLKKAGEVIAIEKDDRLIEYLQEKFSKEIADKKLKVIHEDILEFEPVKYGLKDGDYTVVANIPYYITGYIMRLFLESNNQPKKMVLMVQKEVAERIIANDGKESILSVSVKAYGTPYYIKKVPAEVFSPQPKVDSAILLIDDISKDMFDDKKQEEKFFEIVKKGFAHKRKTLSNNLSEYGNIGKTLELCEISPKIRAEKLSTDQWLKLSEKLK